MDNDKYLGGTIPYAALETVEDGGQTYIAVPLPSLKGTEIAKLKFAPKPRQRCRRVRTALK